MKLRVSRLLAAVAGTAVVLSSVLCAAAETSGPAPKIVVEKPIHEFGNVAPQSKNECKFSFSNAGDANLVIANVATTCGCTVAQLDKKEYAPGEHGEIGVVYTASVAPGLQTKHLHIYSNDPLSPRVELTIKATTVQKVDFSPEKLEYTLADANGGMVELKLSCIDGQPFAIKSFKSTGDAVTTEFDPAKQATEFVLLTKVAADRMGGSQQGRIEIALTHPECPSLMIPFTVLPEFTFEPASINIINARPQQTVTRELWLHNNYGKGFAVEAVSSKDGLIKVSSQEKLENRCKFVLEITPPEPTKPARFTSDVFSVVIKDGPTINIACRIFYSRQ